MNKQLVGTVGRAKLSIKLVLSITVIMLASACDFIDKGSSTHIPADNPGKNASLPDGPGSPGENTDRIDNAQKQTLSCTVTKDEGTLCSQAQDDGYIDYQYDGNGYLDIAIEFESDEVSDVVSFRQYYYDLSNPNRLDKVAVRGETGNFHTLHDYTYDDENDPSDFLADVDDAQDDNPANNTDGYNANLEISRPKLRLEYVCEIDVADASTETCDRDNAREVIRYIYYADGRLYRKEFDVQNNTKIDHQKLYYYTDTLLTRVDTDNFYNGIIDERYTYERDFFDIPDEATLRVFIDNGFAAPGTRGTDRTVSYLIDERNRVSKECYFRGEFEGLQVADDINGVCIEGDAHNFAYHPSWGEAPRQIQIFHWDFTWEEAPCWAGGLDNIDPQTRAIDFLCKQGG